MEGQNTLSMKVKGAANRAKNAGKNLYNRAGNKMRGMKKTLMKGKNIGSKMGKGFKRVKGVMSKGMPILSKVGKVGILLGKVGRKKREMEEKFRRFRRGKRQALAIGATLLGGCLLYTSPSPRDS